MKSIRNFVALIILIFGFNEIQAQNNTINVYCWEDMDADGIREAGEPALAPTIQLWTANAAGMPVANTMIMPVLNGSFQQFTTVPAGDYVVLFAVDGNFPNYYLTEFNADGGNMQNNDMDDDSDADPSKVWQTNFRYTYKFTLTSNETYQNIGAGYYQASSIGDYVWQDFDGDGVQDAGDAGLPVSVGITVWDVLTNAPANYINGTPIGTINSTAGSGAYIINDLAPGEYRLTFSEPANWQRTVAGQGNVNLDSDPDPTSGETASIVVISNDEIDDIDAGYYNPVDIGDKVWEDMDGDGIQEAGEPAIANVQVDIEGTTGSGANYTDNVTTNAAGIYVFEDVPPGNYTITFTKPTTNHFFTKVDQGGDDDLDSDPDRANGEVDNISVVSSDPNITDIDAGMFRGAKVSDLVWEDYDGDGIQDAGEPGLTPTVDIEIYNALTNAPAIDAEDNPAGPVTSAAGTGLYEFDKLWPGEYYVKFETPADPIWKRTLQNQGANDDVDSDANVTTGETDDFTLESNDDIENIDAGYFRVSSIGDYVWEDMDGDGLQDSGEPALANIPVSLTDDLDNPADDAEGNPVPATTSDAAGEYLFENLRPGNYKVVFGDLAPYYRTLAHAAGGPTDAADVANDSDADQVSGQSHVIIITSNEPMQEELDIDAGYYRAGEINGKVWEDCNGNGLEDSGDDMGLDGWTVEIRTQGGDPVYDVNGNLVGPIVTSGGGMYSFMDLPPGNYQIIWTELAPMEFTTPNVTGANTDANDVDNDSDAAQGGASHVIMLESNETVTGIDAGAFERIDLTGFVFGDDAMNPNGIFDMGENGIGMITVELWTVSGGSCPGGVDGLVETQDTDANGAYNFEDLPPGAYIVRIAPSVLQQGGALFGFSASTPVEYCIDLDCNFDPDDRDYDFGFYFDCMGGGGPITQHPNCQIASENPVICDLNILDQFCGSMFTSFSPPPVPTPLCPGGGAPHNMSWFAFVAGFGDYEIVLRPFNCTPVGNNIGIQAGIYTDCSFSEAVFCQPNCSTAPISLPSTSLVPGETYYFFLDGCAGSICDYEVDVTGNYQIYDLPIPTGIEYDAEGCMPICPGKSVYFELQGLDLEIDYIWSVKDLATGLTPNGMVFPDDWPLTLENNVTLEFPYEGTFEVCMDEATNSCQTRGPVCVEIEIGGIDDEIFDADPTTEVQDAFVICEDNFPWDAMSPDKNGNTPMDTNGDDLGWQGPALNAGPNPQMFEITTDCGCMYNQQILVQSAVVNDPELVTFILCDDETPYAYDGGAFNVSFEYSEPIEHKLQSIKQVNGCDSTVLINAYVFKIFDAGFTELACDNIIGGVLVRFGTDNTQIQNTLGAFIDYIWYDPDGVEIDNSNTIGDDYCYFPESGTYTCVVKFTYQNDTMTSPKICEFEYMYDFDISTYLPAEVEIDIAETLCPGTGLDTISVINPNEEFTYTWTWPADAIYISGQGGPNLILNWSNSTGGTVTVYATNGCGDGPVLVKDIYIPPTIQSEFSFTPEVCEGTPATISATSPNSGLSSYIWDWDGGVVQGSGIGRGPHQVIWDTPGQKTVTLQVEDFGCFSSIRSHVVNVVAQVPAPIVSCSSTKDEVIFTWTAPPGVTGYTINIPTGQTGVLTGTTYTVTGLPINMDVTLILTSLVPGPCPDPVSVASTCTTQDCIPPVVTLDTPKEEVCLTTNTPVITLIPGITPADAGGTPTFSGPGIINDTQPVFDPNIAGLGTHSITYRHTDKDGCISTPANVQITVLPTPTSDFTILDDLICITEATSIKYTGNLLGANYNYTFDGGDATTPGVGPFPVTWSSTGVKTITLTVEKDGCTSTPSSRTLTVQDTLPNFVVNCRAQGLDFVEFEWAPVPGVTSYQISINGGAPVTQTTRTYKVTGLMEDEAATITVTAISTNECPDKSASETCKATACPPVTLNITAVPDICLYPNTATIPLVVTASGNTGIGTPIITWSGPGVAPGTSVFDPNAAGKGNHNIKVEFLENGCLYENSFNIKVNKQPRASFSGDDRICVTDEYVAQYSGSAGNNIVFNWSQNPVASANNQYRFSFATAGVFTINLTVDSLGCTSAPFSDQITVEPELTVPSADSIKCAEFLDKIDFSWGDINCASSYRVFINNVLQGVQNNTNFSQLNLLEGEKVTLRVEYISDCECDDISITKECIAKRCPPVQLSLAPAITEICQESIAGTIRVNINISGNNNTGTGVWSGSSAVSQSGQFDPAAAGLGTHQVVYTYTQENCTFTAEASISVYPTPGLTIDVVQPECYDDVTGLVNFSGNGGTGNLSYTLDNRAVTGGSAPVSSGNHIVLVQDEKGCKISKNFTIRIPTEPVIEITGPINVTTNTNATYSINANAFGSFAIDSIVWTVNGVRMPCPGLINCFSQETTNNNPGQFEYEVVVFYDGSCTVRAKITANVRTILITTVPNIITPGSDINSRFTVTTNDPTVIVKKMSIYDRWGEVMFEARDFNPTLDPVGWDGRFGGKELLPGVFVYKIEIQSTTLAGKPKFEILTGDVTLIK